MAEKELRRMSRPELIEIIYALKSNEESLQKKNAHLEEQLNDRTYDYVKINADYRS